MKVCRNCGCPIDDNDELCRELTCELYGKRANARSDSTAVYGVNRSNERMWSQSGTT